MFDCRIAPAATDVLCCVVNAILLRRQLPREYQQQHACCAPLVTCFCVTAVIGHRQKRRQEPNA